MFTLRLLVAAVALVAANEASALDIGRNQARYDIAVRLPEGASFRNAGIDRKFEIGGIRGNLRLIQDDYSDCKGLIAERRENWLKNGYDKVLISRADSGNCAIKLENQATGEIASSFYIRLETCDCFAALHFNFAEENHAQYRAIVQGILDSIRANNKQQIAARAPAAGTVTSSMSKVEQAAVTEGAVQEPLVPSEPQEEQKTETEARAEPAQVKAQTGERERRLHEAMERTVVFRIKSLDQYAVQVKFYSKNRRVAWPGRGTAYDLKDSALHSFPLSCEPGEAICYGAWRNRNTGVFWGVGYNAGHGCQQCCRICGSQTWTFVLNDAPDANGISSPTDTQVFLNSLANGMAVGAAIDDLPPPAN
jgi:hypothetical protein